MNNQIVMEDSVNEEHPDELDGNTDDFITSSFSFTFKTFLFAGVKQAKKIPAQVLSSFTSAFVSCDVLTIAPEDIDAFQQEHPDTYVSATLTSNVTADVTAYVDSPEISDQVYDEFAPIIKSIDVGFYATPRMSSFDSYQQDVDHVYTDITAAGLGYISSSSYTSAFETYVDDEGITRQRLSSVTPDDMHYENVDTYETIAPYKDRLIWKIDEASSSDFPDNVGTYRKFQVQ